MWYCLSLQSTRFQLNLFFFWEYRRDRLGVRGHPLRRCLRPHERQSPVMIPKRRRRRKRRRLHHPLLPRDRVRAVVGAVETILSAVVHPDDTTIARKRITTATTTTAATLTPEDGVEVITTTTTTTRVGTTIRVDAADVVVDAATNMAAAAAKYHDSKGSPRGTRSSCSIRADRETRTPNAPSSVVPWRHSFRVG